MEREIDKLNRSIGGIKDLTKLPDALFVVDVGYHAIAVAEAHKLGIPVIGVVDTNNSPEGIERVIPGNDDSAKAIALYTRGIDRKSTRLNSSHVAISYAVFCLK